MSTKDDYTFAEDDTIHMSDLEIGDILEFERKVGPFTYHHCGNYAGNNMIIHKGTAPGVGGFQALHAKWNNDIGYRIDSIEQVARGSKVYRNNMFDDTISPSKEELILRAKAMYGEDDYDLLYNNCQHFCTRLRYNVAFSRQSELLTKGLLTSAEHDFTTKMVQVSFDDGDFNLASSDIINKYEYKYRYKDRLTLSDNRKPSENKDLIVMTFSQTTTNYTSSFEKQSQNAVPLFNTGFNVVFLSTSVGAQMLRTIASSFKFQPHNVELILNTGLKFVLFNTSTEVQISRTNTSSFECQQNNALSLPSTGFFHMFFDRSVEGQMSRTITSSFEKQSLNAEQLFNVDFNSIASTETQTPRTVTSFENQPQNAHLFNTHMCADVIDKHVKTQMPRTRTSSFEYRLQNAPHVLKTDLCADSFYKYVKTQTPRSITSSFENRPQNAPHLFNTDWCADSFDTSVETQIPRTITSSFEDQPHNAQHCFNTDLCFNFCFENKFLHAHKCSDMLKEDQMTIIKCFFPSGLDLYEELSSSDVNRLLLARSLENQMPRTITSSLEILQHNALPFLNTGCNLISSIHL